MEITISGNDKKLLQQVEALAKRLGLQTKGSIEKEKLEKEEENKSEKLYLLMQEAAAAGDLFQSIKDPVAWQREQRKDRVLYGRGE